MEDFQDTGNNGNPEDDSQHSTDEKEVIAGIDEQSHESSINVYININRIARWRASRRERETETEHRLRLDIEQQRKSDERRRRKQLESNIEELNHLKNEAFIKSSERYVRSLIETDEERKVRLNNETNRKRIERRNRDELVRVFVYMHRMKPERQYDLYTEKREDAWKQTALRSSNERNKILLTHRFQTINSIMS